MIAPTSISNFDEIVKKMIFKSEGKNITQPRNIVGNDHTVTYGYGYTFIRKDSNDVWSIYENLNDDLFEIGIILNGEEEKMLNNIVKALNNKDYNLADNIIVKLNQEWKTRYVDLTDPEAQTLYEREIQRKKDYILAQFKSVLGDTNGQALYNGLQNSREMASLLSLAYNAPALVGKNLTRAMWEGNRAEAWFEIRYGWKEGTKERGNEQFNNGWASRRYFEAQMFGLYDDPNAVRTDDAQEIFKMLQNNRLEIARREAHYGIAFDGTRGTSRDSSGRTPLEASRQDFSGLLSYVEKGAIQDLLSALEPGKEKLLADLRDFHPEIADKLSKDSFAATNIYLNPHKPTDTDRSSNLNSFPYQLLYEPNGTNDLMIGMDQSDYMYGNKGNDVLIGDRGNDWLWGGEGTDVLDGDEGDDFLFGGKGNDTMYGGVGDDTYFIDPGDGEDTIEDKEGNNKIYLCDKEIRFFYYDGTTYRSLDGWQTIDISTGEVTDVPTGTKVILNENFEWGDFGTTLVTLPTDPVTDNTINGTDQGWQDDPGDDFYDTALNDKIFALGGDDYVICNIGGANWILGGDGCDSIDGELSSSCIIEGGAGSDIVIGE